jgi:tRNA(Ile)-lysidine synthase
MSLQAKSQTIAPGSIRFTAALERRVLDQIRKSRIFTPGEHVLVGVSGGPDSTALLSILSRLRPKLQIDLTVAHFDHMLRTRREAGDDARFVKEVARALGVPLVTGAADVRASARRNHHSLEDTARRLRYAFLGEQALSSAASCVSVGHTMDDQAETVLLHLIRGTGLQGLAGMRARAPWPFGAGPDLARPLLRVYRRDTERYCRELGIEPRADPTNDLPIAARNRVRGELMPVLRRFNPRIEESIARLAATAGSESGYLDELARSYFSDIASITSSAVSISRRDLLAAHPAMARRLIRLALEQARGAAVDVETLHVETLRDALQQPPGSYSLPAGLTATTNHRSLIIHSGPVPTARQIPETKLSVPGRTRAGGWVISSEILPIPRSFREASPEEAYLDVASTGPDLTIRSRHPGDRLRPLGLGGDKKLQDILVDAKVPARERGGVPLLCAGDQIAWVIGHCIDERFALAAESQQALHIVATRRNITATPDT